jgi:hypothetical protein
VAGDLQAGMPLPLAMPDRKILGAMLRVEEEQVTRNPTDVKMKIKHQ